MANGKFVSSAAIWVTTPGCAEFIENSSSRMRIVGRRFLPYPTSRSAKKLILGNAKPGRNVSEDVRTWSMVLVAETADLGLVPTTPLRSLNLSDFFITQNTA